MNLVLPIFSFKNTASLFTFYYVIIPLVLIFMFFTGLKRVRNQL